MVKNLAPGAVSVIELMAACTVGLYQPARSRMSTNAPVPLPAPECETKDLLNVVEV